MVWSVFRYTPPMPVPAMSSSLAHFRLVSPPTLTGKAMVNENASWSFAGGVNGTLGTAGLIDAGSGVQAHGVLGFLQVANAGYHSALPCEEVSFGVEIL